MTQPLMPKATAVWLVDNTSLTFDQIGDFCRLHPLEVKGIADGDVAQGIKGFDPVASGQLTREQIEKAQENADYKLELVEPVHDVPEQPRRSGKRYTPHFLKSHTLLQPSPPNLPRQYMATWPLLSLCLGNIGSRKLRNFQMQLSILIKQSNNVFLINAF